MGDTLTKFKAAVVQAAPQLFDREASIAKACRLTADASAQGARLVLFPEAFVPAYPRGLTFGTVVGNRTDLGRQVWERYWKNSVDVPGPATRALGSAARETGTYLAIGVIERDTEYSHGTLTVPCSISAQMARCWESIVSSSLPPWND